MHALLHALLHACMRCAQAVMPGRPFPGRHSGRAGGAEGRGSGVAGWVWDWACLGLSRLSTRLSLPLLQVGAQVMLVKNLELGGSRMLASQAARGVALHAADVLLYCTGTAFLQSAASWRCSSSSCSAVMPGRHPAPSASHSPPRPASVHVLPQVNGSRGVVTRFLSRDEYINQLRGEMAAAKRAASRPGGGGDLPLSPGLGGGGPLSPLSAQRAAAMKLDKVARQLQIASK